MKMKLLMFSALAILAPGMTGVPARAMPVTSLERATPADTIQVYHRSRPHRRARVIVYPEYYEASPYAAYPDYSYYYPYARGFGDTSNAIRGNLRGCSVDLGYGRYESCDK